MTPPALGRLIPKGNSFTYVSNYSRPAFSLWGEGGTVLAGLYDALHGVGIQFSDLSFVGQGQAGSELAAKVRLGDRSSLTVKMDRFEATIRNYVAGDLDKLAELIARTEAWIRVATPDHRFAARTIELFIHADVTGTSAGEVLRSLGTVDRRIDAISRGHGVNFHYDFPAHNSRLDLMVDHSLSVADGLYLHFGLLLLGDVIDYTEALTWGRQVLSSILEDIGLEIPEQ